MRFPKAGLGRKVLVIDDEGDFLSEVQTLLEGNGYRVVTAENGRAGLALAGEERPSLILLDIVMPGPDGYVVLSRLANDEKTRRIPVVMLTAKGESDSILLAQQMRAKDYLIKPFSADDLLDIVRKNIR